VAQGTSNPEIVDIDRIEVLRGRRARTSAATPSAAPSYHDQAADQRLLAEASAQYSSFNTLDSHVS